MRDFPSSTHKQYLHKLLLIKHQIMNNIKYFTLLPLLLVLTVGCNNTETSRKSKQTDASGIEHSNSFHLDFISYDMDGREFPQHMEKVPQRIVTNNLSCTEILIELGVKDRIVGILELDNGPNGKWEKELSQLDVIGDKMKTNKEVIASYEPDLFIGSGRGMNEAFQGTITSYNNLGIAVYSQRASINRINPTMATIIEDVRNIGEILDVKERAEEYSSELQQKYDKVLSQIKVSNKGAQELTLLAIYAMDTQKKQYSCPVVSNGLQYDILKTLNLKPAIQGHSRDNNLEHLISVNPDIIVYISSDRLKESDEKVWNLFMTDPLIQNVSAIKNKRVIMINYDDFLDYGPRQFDTLEKLYYAIYESNLDS